jgi:hypothetical protein
MFSQAALTDELMEAVAPSHGLIDDIDTKMLSSKKIYL